MRKPPQGVETPLAVSTWPHIRAGSTVESEMGWVVLAMAPAAVMSVWVFGTDALRVILYSCLFCLAFEALGVKMFHGHDSVRGALFNGSALISGILLAFNLPANAPFWVIGVGALVAMILGKHVFGGLGQNPFNPVLVARVFLLIAFPTYLTTWPKPSQGLGTWGVDAVTAATPLGVLKTEGVGAAMESFDYLSMAVGTIGGCIGEVSAILLVIGGIVLIVKGIIKPDIPVTYIGTVFILTLISWAISPATQADPLFHILAGGLMLGAFYMATDLVTSPLSRKGMWVFGVGCGFLTFVIRIFGSYPEGVSFAILIMNGFVPLIDRYIRPRRFGLRKKAA